MSKQTIHLRSVTLNNFLSGNKNKSHKGFVRLACASIKFLAHRPVEVRSHRVKLYVFFHLRDRKRVPV